VQLLAQLLDHPAWPVLNKVMKERRQQHFNDITNALIGGKTVPKDLIEWKRGFFEGMAFLLRQPQAKANQLARELAKREEVQHDA